MTNLTILNTQISTFENLYSLTDLHKVSGGENKHKPVLFLANLKTQALIDELQKETSVGISTSTDEQCRNSYTAVKTINGGKNKGTYACKEIVIAYAMWISPKFHLIVLRAFLSMYEPKPNQLASPSEKQQIKQAVNIAKHRTGRTYQNIYTVLFNYLSINKLDALTHKDFDRALAYINRLETIEYPQQTASLPAPAPVPTPQPAQPRLLDVADLFKQRIDTKLHCNLRTIAAVAQTLYIDTAEALKTLETLMEELKQLDFPRKHLL